MKISKKARRAVGLVLLSLAAFIAFYDCNDSYANDFNSKKARTLMNEDFKNNNEEKEITKSHFPTISDSQFDKMNGLQIVLPSVIDENPQEILTELFSNPESVFDEKHRDCKATSQVHLSFDATNTVVLSTFDENGVEKNQGGDEFYITYSTPLEGLSNVPPDAVAHVKDLQNGQYMLEFVQPLLPFEVERLERDILPGGIFTVFLQYTCGLGSYMPPMKQSWNHGGAINSKWEAKVPDNFLPPIVMARDRPRPKSFGEELASYRAIFGIGNSLMRQFMGGYEPHLDHMGNSRRENFGSNIENIDSVLSTPLPLSLSTVDTFIWNTKWLVQEQGIKGDDGKDCALLLGSGVWDLLANNEEDQPNFDDHLQAVRELIGVVKDLTRAKLYWKSMTAVHIHRVVNNIHRFDRVRYCSTSRAKMLHDGQMALMKELDIPVLDMYNFTYEAADHTQNGDARHYDGIFNEWLMDYFYPVENGITEMRFSESQSAVEERFV